MSNQASVIPSAPVTKPATQGDAVIKAVRDVLGSSYQQGIKVTLSDEQRKAVTEILVAGFTERKIPLKPSPANDAKLNDVKQLNAYVKGLINNWLVKSPLLSGKPIKAKAVAPNKAAPAEAKDPSAGAAVKTSDPIAAKPDETIASMARDLPSAGNKKPAPAAPKK